MIAAAATAKPVITGQPQSPSVRVGTSARFLVRVVGVGLTYLWQQKLPGGQWVTVSANANNFYVSTGVPSHNKAQYRVLVRNSGGQAISAVATMTVVTPLPVITARPATAHVTAGTALNFVVAATGYGLVYRWQSRTPGKAWALVAGATRPWLTVGATTSKNAFQYRAAVSNPGGVTYSPPATLIVDSTRADPFRANTVVRLTDWTVRIEPTNTDAWARVHAADLGPAPAAGNRYVAAYVDVRYLGANSQYPYFDLDVSFIGGNGRTYTDTDKLYWNNSIYSIDPLYYNATGQFASIVEVPAAAVAGGRWHIEDTGNYENVKTAWFGLS